MVTFALGRSPQPGIRAEVPPTKSSQRVLARASLGATLVGTDLVSKARTGLTTSLTACMLSLSLAMLAPLAVPGPSRALSDPVVVETQSALSLEDQRIAEIYKKADLSVVTIFDSTVAGQLSGTGQQQEGNGSGIVYDKRGVVVTNYHVLAKAVDAIGISKAVQTKTPVARVVAVVDAASRRQQSLPAYVVGADKARDLLVLQVVTPDDSTTLYPARLGNSSDVRVGATILSLGSPFGFEHSMSKGIVSAKNRGFQSYTGSTISGAFQIDAATNPGNSGGPVVDLDGEVVGVNTAIFTNTGVSSRIGFAIPSNTVSKIVDEILDFGEVRRASLGIKPAADNVKNSLGTVAEGVLIQTVEKGGPSDGKLNGISRGVGGIVPGDVIVGIDGKEVRSIFDLNQILEDKRIGDTVEVSVVRGAGGAGDASKTSSVQVTLAKE
jgi:S1-C subfamily serine protease